MPDALFEQELRAMNSYWRAADYLSVGQFYLYDNPLRETAAVHYRSMFA